MRDVCVVQSPSPLGIYILTLSLVLKYIRFVDHSDSCFVHHLNFIIFEV